MDLRRLSSSFVLAAGVVGIAAGPLACGGTEVTPPPAETTDDVDLPVESGLPTEAGLAARIEAQVTGSFALRSSVAATKSVPLVGETENISTLTSFVTITRNGDGFTFVEQPCHLDLRFDTDAVAMSIDDRVPQSVQPLTSSIQFVEDGDVVRFSRPETVMVVGAVLTDLANEKLPTGDGDRRVRDDEQDGQPGVTVHVTGVFSGDAYAVQRSHPSYAGTLDADGALRGTTLDRIEQSIIGASNPLLLVPLGTVPLDDPAKNELLLVKVPGAGSCADVLASTALTAEG